jgi:hypothetical protein
MRLTMHCTVRMQRATRVILELARNATVNSMRNIRALLHQRGLHTQFGIISDGKHCEHKLRAVTCSSSSCAFSF